MINAEKILRETYPDLKIGKDNKVVLKVVKKLLHEDDFNEVIANNQHLRGFAFLDKLLEHFQFSYQVSPESYNNIPAEGRLIVVANHPIGTLDGLALIKLIRSVRPDVRIVANQVLSHMEPLKSVFLPVNILSEKKLHKQAYKAMLQALENEEAVILFPAGEVSRITPKGVRDGKWKSGFVKLAKKAKCPVLPIHIKAGNSALFYAASTLYKPMGTMLLVQEMFNKKQQELKFKVGAPVPYRAFTDSPESNKELSQRFRKHVMHLGKKGKKPLFDTIATVAHPVDSKALKKALYQSRLLGETKDGKKIFLYEYRDDCPVMQEIARLRELTFRSVEEGTGQPRDLDKYDVYYSHLVLWDDNDLEIVGSYRIGEGHKIMAALGVEGFYTNTLFDLNSEFQALLPHSIELGRSFVQPRYWGQRSLDYLWYGIGAYLREQPQIKYLFGPVSISNAYPQPAKEVIISFYQKQFGSEQQLAKARTPFVVSEQTRQFAAAEFGADYKASYKILNSELKKLGVKVPTLYKQYVELCTDKGCHFIDFNIDPDFNNCIDSLIMVELDKITEKKRQRYIERDLAA
ncbi:lysophospholipid acyltransferase family protein [Methylomarinum vadi]|uniref:lysophospholipid acyltransferase family protein n=1 Tax=Methylomarinum vadi TaxID=438855 RepID=UPI0004DF8E67|nr:lysophospholipid acyltransferase family protein [Methylomarinum vadi]